MIVQGRTVGCPGGGEECTGAYYWSEEIYVQVNSDKTCPFMYTYGDQEQVDCTCTELEGSFELLCGLDSLQGVFAEDCSYFVLAGITYSRSE